jgi:sec-independent protein translocase protein TatC
VFYFLWSFVASGLYPHEQRYVQIFLPFSMGLFLAGAALAFFVVFKFVLAFLFTFYDWMGIDPDPRITDWLTFVLVLPLGFGISFQLPLVMLFLERIGLFTIATYLSNWRVSVLVISFIAAILAPADPYSMMLMVAPLVALYFFGIMLCKWMPRRTSPFGSELA